MTQNVVTYTVEVTTDNPDGKLIPYLTANVQFELSNKKNVLMVENAALRWFPQKEQIDPKHEEGQVAITGLTNLTKPVKCCGFRKGRYVRTDQGRNRTD